MTDRPDLAVTREWMRRGEAMLVRIVGGLSDTDLGDPTLLPGWSRAHVVGHLARNAEALTRLAGWARTGVETPMYRSREQRAADIDTSARHPGPVLRQQLRATAEALAEALDALDPAHWRAEVRSGLGRPMPAAEIPWMRVREVWLHAVDLDAGVGMGDLPIEVVDALLDDVTATLSAREGCPAVRLEALDRDRAWILGGEDGSVVRGPAAGLLSWLVGRDDGASLSVAGDLPVLPRWL